MTLVYRTFRHASTNRPAVGQSVVVALRGQDAPLRELTTDQVGAVTFDVPPGDYDFLALGLRVPFQVTDPAVPYDPWHLTGQGSPVGVVSADTGVVYTDLLATNGARQWISTAPGRTGWAVALGDTDYRNVTDLLVAPVTQIAAPGWGTLLRRVGQTVDFTAYLSLNGSGAPDLLTIPAGFRPRVVQHAPWLTVGGSLGSVVRFTAAGAVTRNYNTNTQNGFITASWSTRDPWPVGALPGVAA